MGQLCHHDGRSSNKAQLRPDYRSDNQAWPVSLQPGVAAVLTVLLENCAQWELRAPRKGPDWGVTVGPLPVHAGPSRTGMEQQQCKGCKNNSFLFMKKNKP